MCFCVCLAGCCSLDFRKAFYRGEWKQEQWKTGCTPHVEPFPVVLQTGTIAAAVCHLAVMQKLYPSANGFWVVLVCAICSSSCIFFASILVTIVEMPECTLTDYSLLYRSGDGQLWLQLMIFKKSVIRKNLYPVIL